MEDPPSGWSIEEVTVVGPRRRIGDENFVFGSSPPPGLAAGRLPFTGEPFIVVGTGGGYLLFYTDFLTDSPREFVPKRVGNMGEREPIGNCMPNRSLFCSDFPSRSRLRNLATSSVKSMHSGSSESLARLR